jgi:GNAT superfamily N-acetyltransferase
MALWRVRATVDDRPGYLSVLTASLALRSVNILAVQVHTTEAGAVDDFLVDAPDTMSESDLLAAVTRGRGRDAFVARAEAQGLADQPTRALALAARLVRDPDGLGEALAGLLDAAEVRWRPDAMAGPGFEPRRMVLADPAGGSYEVVRRDPAFTPAEYARAQALAEVSGALLRHTAETVTLLLPDGSELLIRAATAEDREGVRGLHARSSAESRRLRYLGGADIPADARLQRLIEPERGLTLIAVHAGQAAGPHPGKATGNDDQVPGRAAGKTGQLSGQAAGGSSGNGPGRAGSVADPDGQAHGGGQVVAMANLVGEGELGEVALLVEDAWQHRGIGTALLRRLIGFAADAGLAALVAHTAADNAAMLSTLRRFGGRGGDLDGGMLTVTLPVAGHRSPVTP